ELGEREEPGSAAAAEDDGQDVTHVAILVACPAELYSALRAGRPASRRCSSFTYRQYAHSSRLPSQAPRSEARYTPWPDRPLVRGRSRPCVAAVSGALHNRHTEFTDRSATD